MTLPIHWTGSRNYYKDRHAYLPEAIVIHRLDRSLESTDDLFLQPGAGLSLHYAVGTTGEIHQYVHDPDTAWHCGKVYAPSWQGLKSVSPGTFINPNYYTIGIGVETRPGTEVSQLVYLTVAELISSLCLKWNIPADSDHIIAHSAINSGVNSPGNSVNFGKLLGLVATEPAGPAAVPAETLQLVMEPGRVKTTATLNVRKAMPRVAAPLVRKLEKGTLADYRGYVLNGESIGGNRKWHLDHDGNYFWSGGVVHLDGTASVIAPEPVRGADPGGPGPAVSADPEGKAKTLREEDIQACAREFGLEAILIKTVYTVESNGDGFLKDGRPRILFEGHIFWKQLQDKGIPPEPYVKGNEDILYPTWTKQYYSRNPADEYQRLEKAVRIDREAAYMATSWGLFQIMGMNYKAADFPSVEAFVSAQQESAYRQLRAFLEFIRNEHLLDLLRQQQWEAFARHYNGPDYKENQYDIKLKNAYAALLGNEPA
ncbi:MAG: DUF3380 domain-containing protein [Cytophagales bacterium]|nr:DUF3380 domain-containing protein [Cytophagales bacterium]